MAWGGGLLDYSRMNLVYLCGKRERFTREQTTSAVPLLITSPRRVMTSSCEVLIFLHVLATCIESLGKRAPSNSSDEGPPGPLMAVTG